MNELWQLMKHCVFIDTVNSNNSIRRQFGVFDIFPPSVLPEYGDTSIAYVIL